MLWLSYLGVGVIAGVLAGLLGVGGGIVIVPALTFLFTSQNLSPQYTLHLALGTSLATILFTSVSSFRSHHLKGAVDWGIVKRIAPGIVAGTLAGTFLAARMSTRGLKGFFVVFIFYVAVQMLLDIRPKAHRELPGKWGTAAAGSFIGLVSSLVGIGGGSMSVPFMLWCNVGVLRAIGTSAAIGFPIALAGAVGYVLNGIGKELPPMTMGFVYLPALAGIAAASYLTAPLGARIAHALPVAMLKRFFACLLIATGVKMVLGG
ncbi:MAG TPA: sulfite exporter TauE/SafE family protein [Verrucomicrobiae bacterium]|nr:sulfite exporter TauE/SafE family protein [Verrucomicrobiae bacterium]